MIVFYDSIGKPTAYTEDMQTVYLFNGKPVAYFYQGDLYGFNGCYFGYYVDGWVRDRLGQCVFFTEGAAGIPLTPMKRKAPIKNIKQLLPPKSSKQPAPPKPTKNAAWSAISGEVFFEQ